MKIALLVLAPLLIGGVFNTVQASRELPSADMALMELYTRHAAQGEQLIGPYSRIGWNHPGPFYFYSLLPFYLLSAQQSWSLYVSSTLIVSLCAFLLILILRRELDSDAFLCAALLVSMYIVYSGPRVLSFPWNPYVTIVPLGLLLVLSAQFAAGRWRTFILLLILGSFITQSHVQYVPVVTCVIAVAFVFAVRRVKPSFKMLMISLSFFLLLWAAPIYQELRSDEGNIEKILTYFNGAAGSTALWTAFSVAGKEIGWGIVDLPSVFGADPDNFVPGIVMLFLQTAALGFCAFKAAKKKQDFLFHLAFLSVASIVVATWSATRIPDEIRRSYMHFWISIFGLITYIVVIAALIEKRSAGRISLAATAAALVLFAWFGLKDAVPGKGQGGDSLSKATMAIADRYVQGNRAPLRFDFQIEGIWPVAAGVLLQLDKMGVSYCVEDRFLYMFGEALDCDVFTLREFNEIQFLNQKNSARPPIFEARPVFIYGNQ